MNTFIVLTRSIEDFTVVEVVVERVVVVAVKAASIANDATKYQNCFYANVFHGSLK